MGPSDPISRILDHKCFYDKLGIKRGSSPRDIRHAYLQLSKVCHPDKNDHPNANEAFQQINTAYKTLSTNQKAYDLNGSHVDGTEQTLNEVISQIFREFMSGHYDSLIYIIEHMQTLNPDISFNPDRARNVLGTVREFCLYTTQCWDTAKFDIITVYEIHQKLTNMSYFDLIGRAKLSCALSKGMLTIPLTVLKSDITADQEIMCSLLVKLICFLDGCEQKLDQSSRLLSGWR